MKFYNIRSSDISQLLTLCIPKCVSAGCDFALWKSTCEHECPHSRKEICWIVRIPEISQGIGVNYF